MSYFHLQITYQCIVNDTFLRVTLSKQKCYLMYQLKTSIIKVFPIQCIKNSKWYFSLNMTHNLWLLNSVWCRDLETRHWRGSLQKIVSFKKTKMWSIPKPLSNKSDRFKKWIITSPCPLIFLCFKNIWQYCYI